MRVLVRHLLPVAASEAQRVLVAVGGGVEPGGRVEAVVGEGLFGCGAQQLQKVQLDDVDGNAICPGVGKLEEDTMHIRHSKHSVFLSLQTLITLNPPPAGFAQFFVNALLHSIKHSHHVFVCSDLLLTSASHQATT